MVNNHKHNLKIKITGIKMQVNLDHKNSYHFVKEIQSPEQIKVNLYRLVAALMTIDKNQITSFDDLKCKIENYLKTNIDQDYEINIQKRVKELATRQFADPVNTSLEELFSNAYDAICEGSAQEPLIEAQIKKNNALFGDNGIGMAPKDICNLLGFGRSSKNARFNAQADDTKSIGCFGLGFFSSFYHFIHKQFNPLKPVFEPIENGIRIKFYAMLDGRSHRVQAKVFWNNGQFKIETNIKELQKELKLETYKLGFEPFVLRVFEEQNAIQVEIAKSNRNYAGTSIELQSPALNHPEVSILKLKESFAFLQDVKAFINGERINAEDDRQHYWIPGGKIIYDPIVQRSGSLFICCHGRVLQNHSLSGSRVFRRIALLDNHLNITQDRKTVSFQDREFIQFLQNTIRFLWDDESLNLSEKAIFLNSLAPLIKKFSLNKWFTDAFMSVVKTFSYNNNNQIQPIKWLPDLEGFETLGDPSTILLDDAYAPEIHNKADYKTENFELQSRKKLQFPFLLGKNNSRSILLYNPNLFSTGLGPEQLFLRFYLLCEVLKAYNREQDIEDISSLKYSLLKLSSNIKNKLTPVNLWNLLTDEELKTEEYLTCQLSPDNCLVPKINIILESFKNMQAHLPYPKSPKRSLLDLFVGLGKIENGVWLTQMTEKIPCIHIFHLLWLVSNFEKDLTNLQKMIQQIADHPDQSLFVTVLYFFVDHAYVQSRVKSNEIHWTSFVKFYEDVLKALIVFKKNRNHQEIESVVGSLISGELNWDVQKELLELFSDAISKDNSIKFPADFSSSFKFYYKDLEQLIEFPLEVKRSCVDVLLKYAVFFKKFKLDLTYYPTYYAKDYCFFLEVIHSLPNDKVRVAAFAFYMLFNHPLSDVWVGIDKGYILNLRFVCEKFDTLLSEVMSDNPEAFFKSCKATKDKIWEALRFLSQATYEKDDPEHSPPIKRMDDFEREKYFPYLLALQRLKEGTGKSDADLQIEINHVYLSYFESMNCFDSSTRHLFYQAFLGNNVNIKAYPNLWRSDQMETFKFLHEDPDVLQEGKISSSDAQKLIINARRQNRDKGAYINELTKNSYQGKATELHVHAYQHLASNSFVVRFRDNGHGMNKTGVKSLKLPGLSTKDITGNGENHGWGFYQALGTFSRVEVETSSGEEKTLIVFQTKDENLLSYTIPFEEECEQGTSLTLIKPFSSDPNVEYVEFQSELVGRLSHFKGLKIFFENKCINEEEKAASPILEVEKPIIEKGLKTGTIKVSINKGEEHLLYIGDLRQGRLESRYLAFLPDKVLDFLNKTSYSFSLFLPRIPETMNRADQLKDNSLDIAICNALLEACLKAYFKNLSMINHDITKDFWNDFRFFFFDFDAKFEPQIGPSGAVFEKAKGEVLQTLENELKKYHSVHFNYPNTSTLIDLFELAINQKLDDLINVKKPEIDEKGFLLLLLRFPFDNKGNTLLILRQNMRLKLLNHQIIDQSCDYNLTTVHRKDIQELSENLETIVQEIQQEMMLDDAFNSFLLHFQESILARCKAIKAQGNKITVNSPEKEMARQFLKKIAAHFFNETIEVEFFAKNNNIKAYTKPGSNVLFLNQSINEWPDFIALFEDGRDELTEQNIITLCSYLSTLSHEMTHMKEKSDHFTHDSSFFSALAERIFLLLERDYNEEEILKIFNQVCNPNPLKKQKVV